MLERLEISKSNLYDGTLLATFEVMNETHEISLFEILLFLFKSSFWKIFLSKVMAILTPQD